MESHSKKSKIVEDADYVQVERSTIVPNDDVMNAPPHMLAKDVEGQTGKIRSRNVRVRTKNTLEKTVVLNDEETRRPPNMRNPQGEITVDLSPKTNESHLHSTEQEVRDQVQRSVVQNDIGSTPGNSVPYSTRIVDSAAAELRQKTTTIINDFEASLGAVVGYANEPLLPLIKACHPLQDIIVNLSFYVHLAINETPEQPPDSLTIDESAAIRLYTIEWDNGQRSLYSMLNYTLKNDTRENLRPYFKYMKLFLTALSKLPCVPPLTIWRGVTKDLSAQFPPGTSVIWWPFSSCTTELTVLENNMYLGTAGDRTLFSVEVMNGRTIKAHSHFVTEDEILLLPGTQMIVQSQFSPASNLHIIHLKQVKPEEVLLELPFEGIIKVSDNLF